ncbi:MAG: right-handed parallel beta-helix repeat-containing protein [Kiritimatiellae bacterium]|nr:right-handed parallel beta-helix repeat-containing protein [Kiritimatiellia bacterium]
MQSDGWTFFPERLWLTALVGLFAALSLSAAERTEPAVFYVDSAGGSDMADGKSPAAAWQTLNRVNREPLLPGDAVLFRRGGLWRGQLSPRSGEKRECITYGAYGEGDKPIIQQSVEKNAPEDWEEVKPGVWATRSLPVRVAEQLYDLEDSQWRVWCEGGAETEVKRRCEDDFWFNRATCVNSGTSPNHVQFWGPAIANMHPYMLMRIKIRSSRPFSIPGFNISRSSSPWTTAADAVAMGDDITIGSEWKTLEFLVIESRQIDQPPHIHISLGGRIPAGAVLDFLPQGLWRVDHREMERSGPLGCDIGIFICDHGKNWGVKKWKPEDLKSPLDYWYDPAKKRVLVVAAANPATLYKSIELAQTRHVVNQGGAHDVVYDGLAVRYGGAHGFGGGGTRNITIRNCDVYWIGGGLQYWREEDKPVRYGNGIEFWNAASDHLVENNRIWEIYDAALTNQGNGDDSVQRNIVWRNNTIWNAEYSYEFWNRPQDGGAVTENILFEHNTCVNAGGGWAHNQRPDPNGAHLMFYANSAPTTNVVIRNNVFAGCSEYVTRMMTDWRSGLDMHHNLYFTDRPIMWWLGKTKYGPDEFAKYREELGVDRDSVFAQPEFVDAAKHDYRLKPGTAGVSLATDGGPVGVLVPEGK